MDLGTILENKTIIAQVTHDSAVQLYKHFINSCMNIADHKFVSWDWDRGII